MAQAPEGEAPPEAGVGALPPATGRPQRKRIVEVSKSVLEGGGGQRTITGQHEEANAPVGVGGGSRQQQLIGDVRSSFGQLPGVEALHRICHPKVEGPPARRGQPFQQRLPGQFMAEAKTRLSASDGGYDQVRLGGLLQSQEQDVVAHIG